MDSIIFPEIFDSSVKAFFTKKSLSAYIDDICAFLSIERDSIYLPIQKHTDKIQLVDGDLSAKIADAVITRKRGILIGVQVADCVPVLFYDRVKSIVGVAHAGWRGTAAQIVKKAIQVMVREFHSSPEDIKMAFGPSIRWSCYEIGKEVKDAICKATGEGEYYLKKNEGYCLDLPTANLYQAISMGVPNENIWISHECTYCSPNEYNSWRYAKGQTGKQGGFIGIF